ncbi:LLM class flavin-dependent oxidoreductase [Mycobacterium sp. CVI_P3]|uniref:LLM class flavin-dependent oxidoreductase n=1 Tax=Mycobacterium pinniadriaticum TaxID=2994102 RepID=A0ABT3SF83_9MYCO|nr:LLM class flavin-dependent oxidoreductase [Mycobacterium pinniadriaticum]MCX2931748.1 LLM class flavin-dependent oxidoreductase [Mycobacterium pinniadriaticum]MCX2938177.1 LLM class flavin-dependent oxidoreductase [Mycobacterium pinniadriaticum]
MKFGVQISRWRTGIPDIVQWVADEGDDLGIDSAWTSESYGGEAFTPLAWMAAKTTRMRLGTGIVAMPARTPAATAMAAMTLDHISGGRVILGLGVSGQKVAEGWYGQSFGKPLTRTREYVDVVRQAIRRTEPLHYEGDYYQVPPAGSTARGLLCYMHPLRQEVPILLGSQGPKNIALSAEIADGMVTGLFAPKASSWYEKQLNTGFERAGFSSRKPGFEVAAIVDVRCGRTISEAAEPLRPTMAFYIAKMGLPGKNYYYDTFARLGFQELCERVARTYNDDGAEAAAALIPDEMIESIALVGPPDKIQSDLKAWDDSVVDLMVLRGPDEDIKTVLREALA